MSLPSSATIFSPPASTSLSVDSRIGSLGFWEFPAQMNLDFVYRFNEELLSKASPVRVSLENGTEISIAPGSFNANSGVDGAPDIILQTIANLTWPERLRKEHREFTNQLGSEGVDVYEDDEIKLSWTAAASWVTAWARMSCHVCKVYDWKDLNATKACNSFTLFDDMALYTGIVRAWPGRWHLERGPPSFERDAEKIESLDLIHVPNIHGSAAICMLTLHDDLLKVSPRHSVPFYVHGFQRPSPNERSDVTWPYKFDMLNPTGDAVKSDDEPGGLNDEHPSGTEEKKSPLDTRTIVGAIVGVVSGGILIAALVAMYLRCLRRINGFTSEPRVRDSRVETPRRSGETSSRQDCRTLPAAARPQMSSPTPDDPPPPYSEVGRDRTILGERSV